MTSLSGDEYRKLFKLIGRCTTAQLTACEAVIAITKNTSGDEFRELLHVVADYDINQLKEFQGVIDLITKTHMSSCNGDQAAVLVEEGGSTGADQNAMNKKRSAINQKRPPNDSKCQRIGGGSDSEPKAATAHLDDDDEEEEDDDDEEEEVGMEENAEYKNKNKQPVLHLHEASPVTSASIDLGINDVVFGNSPYVSHQGTKAYRSKVEEAYDAYKRQPYGGKKAAFIDKIFTSYQKDCGGRFFTFDKRNKELVLLTDRISVRKLTVEIIYKFTQAKKVDNTLPRGRIFSY